jgi:hypothetical protein
MATFHADTSVQAGQLLLKLNGNTVIVNSGSTNINLPDGEHFVVQWFVKAVPNSTYSLKITSPASAIVDLTKAIKSTGVDYGGFSFNT